MRSALSTRTQLENPKFHQEEVALRDRTRSNKEEQRCTGSGYQYGRGRDESLEGLKRCDDERKSFELHTGRGFYGPWKHRISPIL
jgi:hypothetical protein